MASRGALHPPPSYCVVDHGVVRSAYPLDVRHVQYLRQHAGINTVLQLSLEQLSGPVVQAFTTPYPLATSRHGATLHHDASKDVAPEAAHQNNSGCTIICVHAVAPTQAAGFGSMDAIVQTALDYITDVTYHPLLLCCPQGDVETSAVVACLRRLQGWSTTAALSEAELHVDSPSAVRREVRSCVEGYSFNPARYAPDLMQQRKASRAHLLTQRTHSGEMYALVRSVLRGEPRQGLLEKYRKGRGRRLSVTSDPDTAEAHAAHLEDVLATSSNTGEQPFAQSGQSVRGESPEAALSVPPALGASPQVSGGLGQLGNAAKVPTARRLAGDANKDAVVMSPLLEAALHRAAGLLVLVPQRLDTAAGAAAATGTLAPHEKYWWCPNPPVLDARSTFTADSLIEEDDD